MGESIHKISCNFYLKTNTTIAPEDSFKVMMEIFVQNWIHGVYFRDIRYGNACNGNFSYEISLPTNDTKELYGSVYADTTNGRKYSITMYNIGIYKL
jgi:hypothetical protein